MKMRKKSGLITQRIRLEKLNHIILATLVALVLALTWTAIQAQAQSPDFGQSYKTGSANARPGDLITYTIVAVNDGDSITDGVTLSDTLPAGWVSYAPGSCTYYTETQGAASPCVLTDTSPIWTAPFTAGQRITTTFAVTVTAGEGSLRLPFVNRAYLAWDGGRQEVVFTTTLLSAIPDFTGSYKTLTQSEEHQEIVKGDTLTYSIVALNSGDPVTDVILADPTPPGLEFARCTYTYDDGAPVDCEVPTSPTYTLWVNDLTVGNRITTTITYTATAGTLRWPITNCARLQWGPIEEPLCAERVLINPKAYIYLPLVLRNYPPRFDYVNLSIDGPHNYTYDADITVNLSAGVIGDRIQRVGLRNEGETAWTIQSVVSDTTIDQSFTRTLSDATQLHTIEAIAFGETITSAIASASVYYVPNGGFEQAGLANWTITTNKLPASRVNATVGHPGSTGAAEGSFMLLLGNPSYTGIEDVPLGYASAARTFDVPDEGAPTLVFKYIIWSQDRSTNENYDRFEVYVNDALVFADGNQNAGLAPDKWWRVPSPQNPRDGVTSGWATKRIDLGGYAGQRITVSFENHSRYDNIYNTYTYVDDVHITGGW